MESFKLDYTMAILTVVSFILSVWAFLVPKEFEFASSSKALKMIYKIFSKFLVRLAFVLLTLSFATLFVFGSKRPITDPIASPSISVYIPTPKPSGLGEVRLYTLDPILKNDEAVFINGWTPYVGLKVDGESVPSGIGVTIPKTAQTKYSNESTYTNATHTEVLEYKLCRKYEKMTFSFGIDDSTFDDFQASTPLCKCNIILQSKSSDQALSETDNILYDSSDIYYNFIKHSVTLDVSQIETLRFTFQWDYTPDPTKQNCFNLVIIDPILYLKET